jgi:hypothetical protein
MLISVAGIEPALRLSTICQVATTVAIRSRGSSVPSTSPRFNFDFTINVESRSQLKHHSLLQRLQVLRSSALKNHHFANLEVRYVSIDALLVDKITAVFL